MNLVMKEVWELLMEKKRNFAYKDNIRLQTIRVAMVDCLKKQMIVNIVSLLNNILD